MRMRSALASSETFKKCHRKLDVQMLQKFSDETFSMNEINTQELQTE